MSNSYYNYLPVPLVTKLPLVSAPECEVSSIPTGSLNMHVITLGTPGYNQGNMCAIYLTERVKFQAAAVSHGHWPLPLLMSCTWSPGH